MKVCIDLPSRLSLFRLTSGDKCIGRIYIYDDKLLFEIDANHKTLTTDNLNQLNNLMTKLQPLLNLVSDIKSEITK